MLSATIRIAVVAAALGWSAPALALVCSMVGQGKAEVRTAAGQAIALPEPEVRPCEGAEVRKGSVVACTLGARGRSQCRTFVAQQVITEKELKASAGAGGPLKVLLDVMRGSPSEGDAVSRGAGGRPPMPQGPVLLLEPEVSPDFKGDGSLRGSQGIELRQGGRDGKLVATLSDAGRRSLRVAELKPGQLYTWQVNPAPGQLPTFGTFQLLDEAQRRAARAELRRVRAAAPGDAAAQAAMWAAWLADHECEHEAAEVLRKAGLVAE